MTVPRDAATPWHGQDRTAAVVQVAVRNRGTSREVLGALAHDILTDLGHTGHRSSDTTTDHALAVAPTYLRAHDIRDLVVHGTERLTGHPHLPGILADLATLAGRGNIDRVWLVAEPPVDLQVLAAHPNAVTVELDDATTLWTARRGPDGGGGASGRPPQPAASTSTAAAARTAAAFPPAPGDEALTFLASVEELLDPHDAERVRAATLAAARDAAVECAPYLPGNPRHQAGIYARPWVVHYLRGVIETTRDVNEAVAATRGVQLALFHAGWWLTIDIDDFVNTYLASPPPLRDDDPAVVENWAQLLVLRTPLPAAVTTLAASGVSRAGLESTTIGHLADDLAWVREGWRRHPIPAPARFYVRAQVEHLLANAHTMPGADVTTMPFASHLDATGRLVPATSSQVAGALRIPREQLQVRLNGRPREWAHTGEDAWARRWHLNLHPISATARAADKTTGRRIEGAA